MLQSKIKIATLNCRGLRKENNPKKRKQFIRYLTTSGYDILLLQETHALTEQIIQEFNIQFKTKSSHWTQHCGIVSLNNRYSIQLVQDGIDGGRFILAQIQLTAGTDGDNLSCNIIATILNILWQIWYSLSTLCLYKELLDIPLIYDTLTNTSDSPTLAMGDFNYSYEKYRLTDGSLTSTPTSWFSLFDVHYVDCFKDKKKSTWQLASHSSIIDFIFCDSASHYKVDDLEQRFIGKLWTDHTLLGVSFQYDDPNRRGPGAWKANHFLASRKEFRSALANHLELKTEDYEAIQSLPAS